MCSDSLQHFQFPLMNEPVCFCLMYGSTPMRNLDTFIAFWVLPMQNCSPSIFCRERRFECALPAKGFHWYSIGTMGCTPFFFLIIFSSALWKLSCTYCIHDAYSLLVCTAYTCVIAKCNVNRSSQEWLWEPHTIYWIVGIWRQCGRLARVVYLAAWNSAYDRFVYCVSSAGRQT